ncbi:lipoprotein LpqH [Mycolicibacterium hippocampi]|uniref:lipoprotein LpqH n=1 Tax=Mycolicibacterium hippocampi TaxID=659824 RepID=UPI003518FAE1
MGAVTLVAAGCSDGYEALGTRTAQVLINGSEVDENPRIQCEQVQWVWFIKSMEQNPGFSAQVRTGETVVARLVRIENLGGFTGSSWNAETTAPAIPAGVEAEAEVTDGTFTISGTATGFYQDDPAESATADFEIRTDC